MIQFSSPLFVIFALLLSPAPALLPAPAGTTGGGVPPLAIVCPGTAKLFCGEPFDPSAIGSATAFGGCEPVVVTFADIVGPESCPADRFQFLISRVWTATDACGQSVSCLQEIHILRQVWYLDIKPQSCPNPINGGGVVPIGLLGSAGKDVTQIDPSSIQIWRVKCSAGGGLTPTMVDYSDVGTPYTGALCGCHTLGGDGILDLNLKFDKKAMDQTLNLSSVPKKSTIELVVTARLYDGCEIVAVDCVRVQ